MTIEEYIKSKEKFHLMPFVTIYTAIMDQYLISQLGYQCPKPAYVVQPPQQVTFPTNCCGGVNYASYNNGCGCGCGC